MPDVSGSTLMMAIQTLDDALQSVRRRVRDAGDDADPDDHELLMSYREAADELHAAYEIARLAQSNLPAYDDLVNIRGSQ